MKNHSSAALTETVATFGATASLTIRTSNPQSSGSDPNLINRNKLGSRPYQHMLGVEISNSDAGSCCWLQSVANMWLTGNVTYSTKYVTSSTAPWWKFGQ